MAHTLPFPGTALQASPASKPDAQPRLGLAAHPSTTPTGFQNTFDLVQTLKKAGLGSLELFCMGLKATGCYLARTLSYKGADFELDKIRLGASFRRALGQGGWGGGRRRRLPQGLHGNSPADGRASPWHP
jgi:hypothetical protein